MKYAAFFLLGIGVMIGIYFLIPNKLQTEIEDRQAIIDSLKVEFDTLQIISENQQILIDSLKLILIDRQQNIVYVNKYHDRIIEKIPAYGSDSLSLLLSGEITRYRKNISN